MNFRDAGCAGELTVALTDSVGWARDEQAEAVAESRFVTADGEVWGGFDEQGVAGGVDLVDALLNLGRVHRAWL